MNIHKAEENINETTIKNTSCQKEIKERGKVNKTMEKEKENVKR